MAFLQHTRDKGAENAFGAAHGALRGHYGLLIVRRVCGMAALRRPPTGRQRSRKRGMIVSNWDKERLLRSSVLAGFAAALFATAPVMAQEPEETDAEEEEEASAGDDRIVITGSRLRRNEFTSASPIQVINAEVATLEGLVDTAEILQSASVAAGSFQLNNQFGGFVVEGGTGINSISLRGLGAQRSLVLLNGRRPGPAGTRGQVSGFDLNVIPRVILQRAGDPEGRRGLGLRFRRRGRRGQPDHPDPGR